MFALVINLSFAQSSKTGKITFLSSDIIGIQRIESIYMSNADGSELTKLTERWFKEGNFAKSYGSSALSPDCSRIVFCIGNYDLIKNIGTTANIAILEIDTGEIKIL